MVHRRAPKNIPGGRQNAWNSLTGNDDAVLNSSARWPSIELRSGGMKGSLYAGAGVLLLAAPSLALAEGGPAEIKTKRPAPYERAGLVITTGFGDNYGGWKLHGWGLGAGYDMPMNTKWHLSPYISAGVISDADRVRATPSAGLRLAYGKSQRKVFQVGGGMTTHESLYLHNTRMAGRVLPGFVMAAGQELVRRSGFVWRLLVGIDVTFEARMLGGHVGGTATLEGGWKF